MRERPCRRSRIGIGWLAVRPRKGSADTLSLELTRTPDAVAGVASEGLVKVGFAAETDDLEQNASAKIASKAHTSSPPTTSPTPAAASAPTPTAPSS